MKKYLNKDKLVFCLMIPYVSWSGYALVLNTSIFFKLKPFFWIISFKYNLINQDCKNNNYYTSN